MEFYRQLASRVNRGNDDTGSLPSGLKPAEPGMPDLEAEVTVAGYARLFEDLERVLAEMDASESSAPQVHFDIFLKRKELRTREEQSLVEEWDQFEENREELLVAANQDFIESVRDLAKRGGPVFLLDFSVSPPPETPHLSKMRAMARLLATHAKVSAAKGDYDEAVADIIAGLQLADALAEEPMLLSQLVRIAITGIVWEEARGLLQNAAILSSQPLLDALIDQAGVGANRPAFANAILGDAVTGLHFFERLRNGDEAALQEFFLGEDLGRWLGSGMQDRKYDPNRFGLRPAKRFVQTKFYTSWVARPWINKEERIYSDGMKELSSIAGLPYYEALQALDRNEPVASYTLITRVAMSAIPSSFRALARSEAQLDLMRIGLTLERFRAEEGAYPDTLSAIASRLGGEVPVDPFTGSSYGYSHDGRTFTLYSVGMNGQDDGARHDYANGDIVWRGN
jgi:hypothetical protein